MYFDCDIPFGSGLSSSAGIEVSTMLTILTQFDYPYSKKDVAIWCQKTENEYCKVNCGIMDQFASSNGKKNMAMLLDCKKIECEEGAFLRDNFCISCPRNCKQCKDGNSCLRCETGFYFDADENACVLRICKRGTYKDNVSGECRKCSTPHCSACDEESCFGCVMGYTLQGQSCVPEKCPEGCKTCSSPDSCDACASGYEMVNGECAAVSCPAGKSGG